jgi:hypothetical protein
MPDNILRTIAYITLLSLILSQFGVVDAKSFSAQERNALKAVTGETITVTNVSEDINGDVSSPAALKANPGPDGISLPEAITAAETTSGYDTITFAPSLIGSTIALTGGLPMIFNGNLTIDGNIDANPSPDITLDGTNAACLNGLDIYGASHVVIKGLVIRDFQKHGINISPNTEDGDDIVEDVVIFQNTITDLPYAAISLMPYMQDHVTIRNVEIASNTLQNSKGGISIIAGMGDGASDNEISDVSINGNLIDNPAFDIGIFVSSSASNGLSRNSIRNLEIRGNQIIHHTNSSVLIAGGNDAYCNDNTVDGVVIAENYINGAPVTIEFVTAAGAQAAGNLITNVTISDNVLVSGGIHFGGATGYLGHNNTTSIVVIERNHITSSAANGIYLVAGSDGAYNNLFENLVLRDNFVFGSKDAGILLHGNDSYSPGNVTRNVTITNQTLVNNGVGSSWASGLSINSKYATNIISGVNISNTILWGNGFGDIIRGSVAPDSVSYSVLADPRYLGSNNNIYQSPEFVDPGAMDYRLQATSPCVDSGDPASSVLGAKDLDLNLRVWDGNDDTFAIVDRGAYEYAAIAMQDINVKGDGVSVLNGDNVPVNWDATDFGTATLSQDSVEHIFTIENAGDAALNLTGNPKVEISGADSGDFTIVSQPASQILGGSSVTFTVVFNPTEVGLRKATLSISSNDSDENPYTFAIQGMGVEPVFRMFLPLITR